MIKGKTRKQSLRAYLTCLVFISFMALLYAWDMKVEVYNSTLLAFSYKYGFISRGLLGTAYQLLNYILPIDLMTYEASKTVILIVSLLIFAIIIVFFMYCLSKISDENLLNLEYVIAVLMITIVTMFSHKRNFGRVDIIMLLASVLAAWIIIKGKQIWMVIPLSIIGVVAHQGYVFMYANIILVLLLYKAFTTNEKERKKYIIVFVITFLVISILFVYFEFFSHMESEVIGESIKENAKLLSDDDKYHKTLIEHEIYGIDVTEAEWPMHIETWVEIPLFLILASPFIILGIRLLKNIISACKTKIEKIKYIIVVSGSITLIPLYILKVDYARWDFALMMYYGIVVVALSAMGDKVIISSLNEVINYVKNKYSYWYLFLVYAVVFMPLWDVHVCCYLMKFSNFINDTWLNVW